MRPAIALTCLCLLGCGGATEEKVQPVIPVTPALAVHAEAAAPVATLAQAGPLTRDVYDRLKDQITAKRQELRNEETVLARDPGQTHLLPRLHRYQLRLADLDLSLEDWRGKGMPAAELPALEQLIIGVLAERWHVEVIGPGAPRPQAEPAEPLQVAALDALVPPMPRIQRADEMANASMVQARVHIDPPSMVPAMPAVETVMPAVTPVPAVETALAQTSPPQDMQLAMQTVATTDAAIAADMMLDESMQVMPKRSSDGERDDRVVRKPLGMTKRVKR